MKNCFYVVYYRYSHFCSILFACVKNVLLPILSSCCGLIALCNKINCALFLFCLFCSVLYTYEQGPRYNEEP